ncbi:MAG TPA: hypothetical protein VFP53_00140 [Sphingomicrobium sp.]|nr:hypothetical protein [Sphingomicrobium sp.]
MRIMAFSFLLAGAAGIAGCTYNTAPATVASNGHVCATGSIDANNDGAVTAAEWDAWRASGFGYWDINNDNRIDQAEFNGCFAAGGFYPQAYYNPSYATHYWTAFDINHDGYLSADEYWSAQAWANVDRNHNGILDSNEWNWWDM